LNNFFVFNNLFFFFGRKIDIVFNNFYKDENQDHDLTPLKKKFTINWLLVMFSLYTNEKLKKKLAYIIFLIYITLKKLNYYLKYKFDINLIINEEYPFMSFNTYYLIEP
jgi:hypothetical protein